MTLSTKEIQMTISFVLSFEKGGLRERERERKRERERERERER